MITLEKLKTLGKKTRLRKSVLLLQQLETSLAAGGSAESGFVRGLSRLIGETAGGNDRLDAACRSLEEQPGDLRAMNTLRHVLQSHLGVSPGDWDFYEPGTSRLDAGRRQVLPLRVYLDDIRSPFNVGSIFRTADSFGVKGITVSPFTASPAHPRSLRTSMGCTESVPWEVRPPEALKNEPGVFALELGGEPLDRFAFPEAGTLVIGSEELGVSPEALEAAEGGLGRVSIPMFGTKGSLNVSVAFGIVMHAWREAVRKGPYPFGYGP